MAINYILFFMILVALSVLFASIIANVEQRAHESAIIRALGAQSREIRVIVLSEFMALGVLAGLGAAISAVFSSWMITRTLFNLPFHMTWWPLWVTPICSGLLIAIAGYLACIPVLRRSPMTLLKTFE